MSSTNRTKAREVSIDYYVTPIPAISTFLEELHKDSRDINFDFAKPLTILDPCAGGDPNHPMSYPEALQKWTDKNNLDAHITTLDIRQDSLASNKISYFDYQTDLHNIIITNPPFNIALKIIQKALVDVVDGGLVIMLLRLNFFGSQERKEWLQQNMPIHCYVHSKRMRFMEGKSGDSIEYMHAIWQKGVSPKYTKLRII